MKRWNSVPVPGDVACRAFTHVDKRDDGCWISRYSLGSHGYAQIGWHAKGEPRHAVLCHRASWVHVHGQVPLEMTLDHLCKEKRCVNPDHLRLLPNYENARRTNGRDWPMGVCANGHANTHIVERTTTAKRGRRRVGTVCRVCRDLYYARYEWKRDNPSRGLPDHLLLASERAA